MDGEAAHYDPSERTHSVLEGYRMAYLSWDPRTALSATMPTS